MSAAKTQEVTRISVALPADLRSEIERKAEENELSLTRTIVHLLRVGIEAEMQKKHRLDAMLRQYRECTDPQEAERLSDELGAMIFGR